MPETFTEEEIRRAFETWFKESPPRRESPKECADWLIHYMKEIRMPETFTEEEIRRAFET